MKNSIVVLLWVLVFVLGACREDADPFGEKSVKKKNAGPLSWLSGYPKVMTGAKSIDIAVKTDGDAQIHFMISDRPMNFTPAEFIKQTPATNVATARKGNFSNQWNQEVTRTIPGFSENRDWHVYLLAVTQSDSSLQDSVYHIPVRTKVRQGVAEFYSSSENRLAKYLVYQPEEALKYPEKKYPIAFYLAGKGEMATPEKPINLLQAGMLPHYIHKGNDIPMIVVSIQHITEVWKTKLVDEAITHALRKHPGDEDRTYLIGISAGAFGVWDYAIEYPQRLAAIVPISGSGEAKEACRLKDIAVWAFHNQPDPVVATSASMNLVSGIRECGASQEVKLTIFQDEGHNCWKRVFDPNHPDWELSPDMEKPDIYSWIITKKRKK